MSAHSPGPWKADKNDAEPFYRVVDATGDLVARVRAQWTNGDVNALLIAAAPEMLALLRKMAEPHDCPCHFCDRSRPLTSGDHREGCRLVALLARIDGTVTPA